MMTGLAFAVAAALSPGTHSQDATTTPSSRVSHETLQAVAEALVKADIPALSQLYQSSNDPATHVLAAMALERIHGHFDEASADAKLCATSLHASQPGVALFCERFANGNLRLAGKDREADQADVDTARRYGYGPPVSFEPLRTESPAAGFSIPLVDTDQGTQAAIAIAANGHSLRVTVDTGSYDITLDEKTARDLGVRMLGLDGRTNGLLTTGMQSHYGLLDKLAFAGVTMQDVPVLVVPGHQRLIGLNVLRRLGAIRITRSSIQVYGQDDERPACTEPMLFASNRDGRDLHMVTALSINGAPHVTLLDTGDEFYLNGNQAALKEVTSRSRGHLALGDIGPTTHEAAFSRATADVVIAGQPIRMTFAVFKDANVPWAYALGRGALQDMDFYFDFDNRHTCLLLHDHLH